MRTNQLNSKICASLWGLRHTSVCFPHSSYLMWTYASFIKAGVETVSVHYLFVSRSRFSYVRDTKTNTMTQAFFVLMASYPRVQQKAQEELDTVVGPDRLPTFDDIGSLPCLNAVIRELLRWHSPVPCGLPHRATSDEEYNGYFIPEGTVVFPNAL